MTLLLTGFDAFGEIPDNPSQRVVEEILRQREGGRWQHVVGEVIPTRFEAAGRAVRRLLGEVRPDVLLSLGVAADRDALNLERVALNLDDAAGPDNAARAPRGEPIAPEGPVAYRATLPLEALHEALSRAGFPVVFSNHAGTFVCNHLFYAARHEIETRGLATRCGFLHLPLPAPRAAPGGAASGHGLTLPRMVAAVALCLEVLGA